MTIDSAIEIIKKHGAIGVLALWLFFTNHKVNELEQKLHDCYALKSDTIEQPRPQPKRLVAVLNKNEYDRKKINKEGKG